MDDYAGIARVADGTNKIVLSPGLRFGFESLIAAIRMENLEAFITCFLAVL